MCGILNYAGCKLHSVTFKTKESLAGWCELRNLFCKSHCVTDV